MLAFYPSRACVKGLSNSFCPSVSLSVGLSVCPSDEKFLNLNVEGLNRFERFPKLTVALTL